MEKDIKYHINQSARIIYSMIESKDNWKKSVEDYLKIFYINFPKTIIDAKIIANDVSNFILNNDINILLEFNLSQYEIYNFVYKILITQLYYIFIEEQQCVYTWAMFFILCRKYIYVMYKRMNIIEKYPTKKFFIKLCLFNL